LPAATLLLPYFEVDLATDRSGETTLFSVTNVTDREQIAHVTLWTDYAYPVFAFDIYLTGYDVQSINLYDVIKLGVIASSRGTGTSVSQEGSFSGSNPALNVSACDQLPGTLAPAAVTRMQQAFTIGRLSATGDQPACTEIGSSGHGPNVAIGYATIDVVGACGSPFTPADPAYYNGTLRYDNVLMGDYLQVNSANNFAQGSPMVHIRAIPEGGTAQTRAADPVQYSVNFPRTFYGRFQTGTSKVADARQPLPSAFAPRWILGGRGGFQASFKIWREAKTGANAQCSAYRNLRAYTEVVTFDEDENAVGSAPQPCPSPCIPLESLPSASRHRADTFPLITNGSVAGWMYFNLDDPDSEGAVQAWVISSMRAEERYSADIDALAFGNGCSPAAGESEVSNQAGGAIGPARNINP
jgi:hypothetical protein